MLFESCVLHFAEYAHGAFVHYKPQSAATDTAHALCCSPDVQAGAGSGAASSDVTPDEGVSVPKSQMELQLEPQVAPAADALTVSSSGLGSAGSRAGRDDSDSRGSLSLEQSVVLMSPSLGASASELSCAAAGSLARLVEAPTPTPTLTPMPTPTPTLMPTSGSTSLAAAAESMAFVGVGGLASGATSSSSLASGNHLVAAHRPAASTRSFPGTSEPAGANGASLGAPQHQLAYASASLTGSRRSLCSAGLRAKGLLERCALASLLSPLASRLLRTSFSAR